MTYINVEHLLQISMEKLKWNEPIINLLSYLVFIINDRPQTSLGILD